MLPRFRAQRSMWNDREGRISVGRSDDNPVMDSPACIVSYAASHVGKRVGATHDCVEAWQFIRQSCMIAVGCLRKATHIRDATNHRTNSVQMAGVLLITVQIGYKYQGVY